MSSDASKSSPQTSQRSGAGKAKGLRRWLWVVVGLALVVLLVLALAPKPQPVDLAVIERSSLEVTLDEEGETRVRDRYVVSAPLAGRVLRIELEPGDPVTAGETVLATFQPSAPVMLDARSRAETEAQLRAAEAALGQAKAERERAKAELVFAESEVQRYRRLAEEEIVADEILDNAELRLKTQKQGATAADFQVRTAEHDLELLKVRLMDIEAGPEAGAARQPMEIRSPVDGRVLRRLRESEAVVLAGEPLLEVADPSHLEIVADFLSTDAVRIQAGDPVRIEQWGGDAPLHGTVRRVEPSGFTKVSALGVEEQRVNIIVDFDDARSAWQALGDGFRVEVRVIIWQDDDVLVVPTGALFRHQDGWAVFLETEGKAALTPVELGRRNALGAQVLEGVEAGQRLIVHPSDAIADGVAVEQRDVG